MLLQSVLVFAVCVTWMNGMFLARLGFPLQLWCKKSIPVLAGMLVLALRMLVV